MSNQKYDLNDYEIVGSKEDLTGFKGLIIVPRRLEDGTQPPELFFRKPLNVVYLKDIDNIKWHKNIQISKQGSDKEYGQLVDWWFEQARNDVDYKEMIKDNYHRFGFNVPESTEKAIIHLKTKDRKTAIHKFFIKWLTKGLNWAINRSNKR